MRTLTSAPRSEGDSDVMPTGAVGADSDGTSLPLPMTSLSDAGSLLDEMPSCLPPAESMTDKGGDGSGGHEVLSTVNVRRREARLSLSSMLIEFLRRAGVCTPKRVNRCSSWRRLCDGFM